MVTIIRNVISPAKPSEIETIHSDAWRDIPEYLDEMYTAGFAGFRILGGGDYTVRLRYEIQDDVVIELVTC